MVYFWIEILVYFSINIYKGTQLYAWYLCASGLVLPSTYEPFGAVVNEALIFGLKVLCSQHAGSSYLVCKDNGILFDPLSKKDTIEKMNNFLSLIEIIEGIDMINKPSLMSNHQDEFNKEWIKLTYV